MARRIFLTCFVLLLLSAVLGSLIYRSIVIGPAFYREMMLEADEKLKSAGDSLEEKSLGLHNVAVREDKWSVEFTQSEINGWLGSHLPQQYPRQTPKNASGIRIRLQNEGKCQVVFRLQQGWIHGVISIHLEVFMISNSEQLGIRIEQAKMGWLPIPINRLIDQFNDLAQKADINLVWTQQNDAPTALLTPKFDLKENIGRRVTLQRLLINKEKLVLSGTATASAVE